MENGIVFDRALKVTAIVVFIISGTVNLLTLSGAVYMLQVYDRVLSSHSVETLVALTALVAGLYVAYGTLDVLRAQILIRLAGRLDASLMPRAYAAMVRASAAGQPPARAAQPVRDADSLRTFLAGQGPVAFLDLPWTVIFLLFVWMLSPPLGLITLAGLMLLVLFAVVTNIATRRLEARSSENLIVRASEAEAGVRAAEAAAAMGFASDAGVRFLDSNSRYLGVQNRAGDIVASLSGISKVVRMMLQSGVLGAGAYLAIQGEVTAGAIVAASLAAARALAPVEQAISSWRSCAGFRDSLRRLRAVLDSEPRETVPVSLPYPRTSLVADRVCVVAPESRRLSVAHATFELKAGQGLAIIGRSGAGKSSLLRAVAGVWPAVNGSVRLDGAPIERWASADRGLFIGYVPQCVELYPGTIAENIARLEPGAPATTVMAAAKSAGLHDVVLGLTDGYETKLTAGGAPLSAGQRQQVGLARALYGDPFLVLLDEPNANLDAEGEEALIAAMQGVRQRGGIVVVVAHSRRLLSACDTVAMLDAGRITAFGPKNEILAAPVSSISKTTDRPRPAAASANPVRKVSP